MKSAYQDMALEDLANVWILLQERIDVGHIIPEIIGHFALSSVGRVPSATQYFNFFVWAKVIFVRTFFRISYSIFNAPRVIRYSQKLNLS
jgi:hypothetical protein